MFQQSIVREGGHVSFPKVTGERHYQIPFLKRDGLPFNLKHWQPTVDQLLENVNNDGLMFFMPLARDAHRTVVRITLPDTHRVYH